MRKIILLLCCFGSLFLRAQTGNQVNFTFSVNASNVVTFTNTSVLQPDSIRKSFWSFGDGTGAVLTAALSSISHQYASAGTYNVCLKMYRYNPANLSDSTFLGDACKVVTIQPRCEAGFQWADSVSNSASGHFVRFFGAANTNTGKPITEVCWIFGDGTDTCIRATAGTAPPLNIVHKYSQNGTYTACLKVKFDGGCVAEKCNVLVLSGATPADSCASAFTIQPISATPLGRKFIAQPWHSMGNKPVRICWTFGNGKDTCIQYPPNYAGEYAVELLYVAYGLYEVCATIKYDGGCEKKKCNAVVIAQPTTCSIDLAEVPVPTTSLERKFYVGLMQGRVAEKICWTFGDGTDTCVILSNPVAPQQLMIAHRYAAPGTYTVCANVFYAGGCVAERCKQVSVTVANSNLCGGYMTDSLVNVNTFLFKATAIYRPGDQVSYYNWTFGDGTTGTGQNVYKTFAGPGRYNVCLLIRTTSGCETKICKPVTVSGNVQSQLVLTPNPVINVLTATFISLFQQTLTVKIYNANGLMVRSYVRTANVGANNWVFSDVGTFPTGVYSVVVQSANQFATAIFFKQ